MKNSRKTPKPSMSTKPKPSPLFKYYYGPNEQVYGLTNGQPLPPYGSTGIYWIEPWKLQGQLVGGILTLAPVTRSKTTSTPKKGMRSKSTSRLSAPRLTKMPLTY